MMQPERFGELAAQLWRAKQKLHDLNQQYASVVEIGRAYEHVVHLTEVLANGN